MKKVELTKAKQAPTRANEKLNLVENLKENLNCRNDVCAMSMHEEHVRNLRDENLANRPRRNKTLKVRSAIREIPQGAAPLMFELRARDRVVLRYIKTLKSRHWSTYL